MDKAQLLNQQIGERIRRARIMCGLSQAQLGKKLGITFQQIQKYEKGSNNISAVKLVAVADILGVNVHYFFDAASELLPMRRKFLHLIQSLWQIEQQNPATFLAICNMAAALAPKSDCHAA